MITLLAIAPEDGWAFVRKDGVILLVKPPYTKLATLQVDARTVENAVSTHGFEHVPPERSFASWSGLISFLHGQVLESRKARGRPLPDSGVGESFLQVAPKEVLETFLARVEHELLPNKKWDHAQKLLLAMLKTPRVRSEEDLASRAALLLERAMKLEERAEELRRSACEEAEPLESDFPLAASRYGAERLKEQAHSICETHQIWAFA